MHEHWDGLLILGGGPGWMAVDWSIHWEYVKLILDTCTSVHLPNLEIVKYTAMYGEVLRWTHVRGDFGRRCRLVFQRLAAPRATSYPEVETRVWAAL